MREYTHIIREPLRKGLRPDTREKRGDQFLVEAFNVLPSRHGLKSYETLTDPFSGNEAVSFPFPQLLRGNRVSLLAGSTSLKSVNESVDPWTASSITTYDPASPATPKAITAGSSWHFVDCGDSYFLFNGSCVVFKSGKESLDDASAKVFCQNTVTVQSGCVHKGRVIVGGFDSSNLWQSHWTSIFTAWKAQFGASDPDTGSQDDIGGNWVMWSSIGGGDIPLWLFAQPSYTYDLSIIEQRVIEKIRLNEMGWMMMPFQGTVRRVAPLGELVVVYGDDGVALLKFNPPTEHRPSTYGVVGFKMVGVESRDAVGVSPFLHVFYDASGVLWSVESNGNITRLGYSEFLYDIVGGDAVVSFDEYENRFVIAGANEAFAFGEGALTEHFQRVTGMHFVDGGTVGLSDDLDGATDGQARIVTNIIDFDTRGVKTITSVHIACDTTATLEVAVDYRHDQSSGFTRTGFVPVNSEGVAFIRITGTDMRVVVRADDYADFEIDYMEIKWQSSDKRFRRGPDASSSTTRTG